MKAIIARVGLLSGCIISFCYSQTVSIDSGSGLVLGSNGNVVLTRSCLQSVYSSAAAAISSNHYVFNDGSDGWSAAPGYTNCFIADTWLAMSENTSAFTASQIYNIYRKFIIARDGVGNMPISINRTTGYGVQFYSPTDTFHAHTTGDPIWCVPLLMLQWYNLTGLTTNFTSDLAVLDSAMQGVPRNLSNHLVSAGFVSGSTAWITWGFQDTIQKTGDDLIGSVLYYRAAMAISTLYAANGNVTKAAYYASDAALIASNITALFNTNMFMAASGQNNQIDVVGSAMASAIGLASTTQQAAVNGFLVSNYPSLCDSGGFWRVSPTNWATGWPGGFPNNYNWSWGNYWILSCVSAVSPSLAGSLASRFAQNVAQTQEYQTNGVSNGEANNMESPQGTLAFMTSNSGLVPNSYAAVTIGGPNALVSINGQVSSTGTVVSTQSAASGYAAFVAQSAEPRFLSKASLAPANAKVWDIDNQGATLQVRAINDADTAASIAVTFHRNGAAVDGVLIPILSSDGVVITSGGGGLLGTTRTLTGVDSLSGAGAVSVSTATTKLTSTAPGQTATLADGIDGQVKHVIHDVAGGSIILTPATKTGFSSVTFNNVTDSVTLEFIGARGWVILASRGVTISP